MLSIYAGPSLHPDSRALIAGQGDWQLLPPVKRGDLPALPKPARSKGATIVIADGLFHQELAVGHLEIRQLLEVGVHIWGVSSMGLLRAFEMRQLGMQGFGSIYRRCFEMEDFQDDEVALLHEPGPEYKPVTEPLVHYRACIEDLTEKEKITPEAAEKIITDLKNRWYGERRYSLFRKLLKEHTGEEAAALVPDFGTYRVKQQDLYALLTYLRDHAQL